MSPSRSYSRRVCGWMLYRSAMAEIMTKPSALRRPMCASASGEQDKPARCSLSAARLLAFVHHFRFDHVVLRLTFTARWRLLTARLRATLRAGLLVHHLGQLVRGLGEV